MKKYILLILILLLATTAYSFEVVPEIVPKGKSITPEEADRIYFNPRADDTITLEDNHNNPTWTTDSSLVLKAAETITILGVEFRVKEVESMSESEVKNFILLMNYYKLALWISDDFSRAINRKLLPRFFKVKP